MGNGDALEQLEAAKQECVRLERELAAAQAAIEQARDSDVCECHAFGSLASVDTSALAARDAEARRGQTRVLTEFIDSGDFHGFTVAEALREVERRLALAEKGTDRG